MTITCLWCWVNAHQCRHDQWVQLGANDRASVDAVWSHLFHCFQHGWFLTWPNFRLDCRHNDQEASHFTQHGPGLKETTEMVLESINILQTVEIAKAALFGSCACNMSFWIQNPKLHLKGEEKEWGMKRQNEKKTKRGGKINERRSSHLRTFPKSAEKQGHSASNSCPYAKKNLRSAFFGGKRSNARSTWTEGEKRHYHIPFWLMGIRDPCRGLQQLKKKGGYVVHIKSLLTCLYEVVFFCHRFLCLPLLQRLPFFHFFLHPETSKTILKQLLMFWR